MSGLKLNTSVQKADFSSTRPSVGKVSAWIEADLKRSAQDATVLVEPLPSVDGERRALVERAAQGRLRDIAYGISVTRANLQNADLSVARVFMDVGKTWVEEYGADNVRIVRIEEGEEPQVLATAFAGYTPEGLARFQGTSPGGLSVFVLAALAPATPTPAPTLVETPTLVPVVIPGTAATSGPLSTEAPPLRTGTPSTNWGALVGIVAAVVVAALVTGPIIRWRRGK